MSSDLQKHSIAEQEQALDLYAAEHGMEIVRRYRDEGRSGVTAEHRRGLKQLLRDVQEADPAFACILVLDVTRWGRFQNTDQAAYYDFHCRMHGVEVIYTAEPFINDDSPITALLKGMKRVMAGEYSRELSRKSKSGQSRLVGMGYKMGGSVLYGLRRLVLDEHGKPTVVLQNGQRKAIQSHHVTLIPGPDHEVALVRRIFREFAQGYKNVTDIALTLKAEGVKSHLDRPFTRNALRTMLHNEYYIGNNVWGKTTHYLHSPGVPNPPAKWLRKDGSFEPIIEKSCFAKVQKRFAENRVPRLTGEAMLACMRATLASDGYLTARLIEQRGGPDRLAIRHAFGNLSEAYRLIGFTEGKRWAVAEATATRKLSIAFAEQLAVELAELGQASSLRRRSFTLHLENGKTAGITVAFPMLPNLFRKSIRWMLSDREGLEDVVVIVRLNTDRRTAKDCFLVPKSVWKGMPACLVERNPATIEALRCSTENMAYRLAGLLTKSKCAGGPASKVKATRKMASSSEDG